MPDQKSDEDLMVQYQLGDEDAFGELYQRHAGRILAFLRLKTRNEAQARDIFQAAFFKLHRSRGLYNSSLPFVPWLFTICRNELIDAVRKDRRSLEDVGHELANVPAATESEMSVDLSSLPALQRQAIELRYEQDSSFEQIARVLDTSPTNARQIVSRALKALRGIYGKQ